MIKYSLHLSFWTIFCCFLCISCSKKTFSLEEFDQQFLDTLVVTAPRPASLKTTAPLHRSTAERTWDIHHTKLDLSFDWENQDVIGVATLTMSPYFYASKEITLDAKNFDISSVMCSGKKVPYTLTKKYLTIDLEKTYTKEEKVEVVIDYIAHPSRGDTKSTAITSDQGLFFIDPLGIYPDKPTQIWTQGETEYNSRWFPTIDKPNERCSQEILLTIPDTLVSLSNGKLLSQKQLENGMRQDHWYQEKPHAPYLFMLAIGDYAVVEEFVDGLDYQYLVYPEYKNSAKAIFNHTPEMMDFFQNILDYDYPWDKYSQVIASDYVSGAMENTGAVIFGEFVQQDNRYVHDVPNDKIVAHELFHHWFGDLVTCESWSNLTMNEGFANYGEYLWLEHKYGAFAAEQHRVSELQSYLTTTETNGTHDLIDYQYVDKEDMFDVHSYNKGGLVLHMLRNLIGDEAFFASLQHYLKKYEYSSVEADDLRLAVEEVTGLDLTTFFDQWYFSSGHPLLNVSYVVEEETSQIIMEQTQEAPDHLPVFAFTVNPRIYYVDGTSEQLIWDINKKRDTLLIQNKSIVGAIVFDGNHNLLGQINEERQSDEWHEHLLRNSNEYVDLTGAITQCKSLSEEVISSLKKHPFYEIRLMTLSKYGSYYSDSELMNILTSDPHYLLRKKALESLALESKSQASNVAKIGMQDQSYFVQEEALYITYAVDQNRSFEIIDSLLAANPMPYLAVIGDIKSANPTLEDLSFYNTYVSRAIDNDIYYILTDYISLSKKGGLDTAIQTLQHIRKLKGQSTDYYKNYVYTKAEDELLEFCTETLEKMPEEAQLKYRAELNIPE